MFLTGLTFINFLANTASLRPLAGSPFNTPAISGISLSEPNCLLVIPILPATTDILLGSLNQPFLRASAVLHADIALGTHMEPSLKPILEGYGGDIEVIAQALKAEVTLLFHGLNMGDLLKKERLKHLLTS